MSVPLPNTLSPSKPAKSIGFRLTVIMLSVILLGIVTTLTVAVLISSSAIIRVSLDEVKQNTRAEATAMDKWLTQQEEVMSTLAATVSAVTDFSAEGQVSVFKAVLADNSKYMFDIYMGYPDGKANTASGYEFDYSWWSAPNRDWYKLALTDTTKAHTTSPYVDAQTGDLCISTVRAVNRNGKFAGVVASDIFVNTLKDMVLTSSLHDLGYAMLLDRNGDILVHPNRDFAADKDGNFQNLAKAANGQYDGLWKRIAAGKEPVMRYVDRYGVEQYYGAYALPSTGWLFISVLPTAAVNKPIMSMLFTVIPLGLVILVLAGALIPIVIGKLISKPVSYLTKVADRIANGDLSVSVNAKSNDEIGMLMQSFKRMIDSSAEQERLISRIADGDLTHDVTHRSKDDSLSFALIRMIDSTKKQIGVLERLADGDLTADVTPRCEHDSMSIEMNKMIVNLNTMLREINSAADQMKNISNQTAASAHQLSSGSQEQAEAVAELSATIAQITENTNESSKLAGKAAGFTDTIKANAEQGNRQMNEMTAAVNEINSACTDIGKVTKTIEDIAFQTNLLALNAAVEAARAGDAGKGFAVVAGEVRSLATKSAAAVRDTADLIKDTVEKANLGSRIATDTAASLAGIVNDINENSKLMRDIAKYTDEQFKSITEINSGISQISGVMQQTSSTAKESSSASIEMSGQAQTLESLVAQFKLKSLGR